MLITTVALIRVFQKPLPIEAKSASQKRGLEVATRSYHIMTLAKAVFYESNAQQ